MTYCNTPMDIDYTGTLVNTFQMGDVNADGVVDVDDVNVIVNIILKRDLATNYNGRANVVGGTDVSVSDLNAIINIMLGRQ